MKLVSTIGLILCFSISTLSYAAPNTKVSNFDHSYKGYSELLKKIVLIKSSTSQVKYKLLKSNRIELDQFTKTLSKITNSEFSSWEEKQQISFLINAYNAFTLQLIIDHYPVKSIKKIGSFFSSPWKKKFFTFLNKKTNLDHIEHGLLRKNYSEPRVHFAVNCASIGCPALANTAFTSDELDTLLTKQTKLFLQDSSRNTLLVDKKVIKISKIFDWFEEDFTKGKSSVAMFVAPFITDDPSIQKDISSGKYKIQFHSYNWNLNDEK